MRDERDLRLVKKTKLNMLVARLNDFLKDGLLDVNEQKELFDLLSQVSGQRFQKIKEQMSAAPFDQPPPEIEFDGRYFCFTCKFAFGTRKDCVREVESLGGYVVDKVDPFIDYLVVGFFGSPGLCALDFRPQNRRGFAL